MTDLAQLRETYGNMPDAQLVRIALHEAGDLLPEAVAVLHQELGNRNLADSLGIAVAAQTRQWSAEELNALIERLRHWACPICGATDQPLNVFPIVTMAGFMVFRQRKEELLLACPKCIEGVANKAARSCWLGMFSFTPIRAMFAVLGNDRARAAQKVTEPTKEFTEYVQRNMGKIALVVQQQEGTRRPGWSRLIEVRH